MKILVLGADGYLGWPACMHFSHNGQLRVFNQLAETFSVNQLTEK